MALGFGFNTRYRPPIDARRQAIKETNAFLSWAMSTDQPLPRIPRRRVDRGGFADLLKRPLSGRIISHWWSQTLDRLR